MKKKSGSIFDYVKAHMSFGLIGTGVLLFLFAVFFFHGFLQNEYLQYLLAETSRTEEAVLSASAVNINSMLRDAIMTCADIVIDDELYQRVENAVESDKTSQTVALLNTQLNNITHYNNIVAVAIVTDEGLVCEYGRYWSRGGYRNLWQGENLENASWLYERVMERIAANTVISYEVSTEPLSHENFPNKLFFHLAFPLLGNKVHKSQSCAVVIFTISLDSIIEASALSNIVQGDYISEYITDKNGIVLYHSDSSMQGQKEENLTENNVEKLESKMNYLGWTIHINIDTDQVKQHVNTMFGQGVGVYLVFLLICIFIWQFLLWRILRPVGVIGKSMENIRNGNLSEKIHIEGTHELWQLAEQYNYTVEALDCQRKETHREYEEKMIMLQKCNAAEKEALESQINAHFLCNTLGAINYSAMENGDTEVSVLLKNLSGILYYAFSRETRSVTFGEEIEWVRQYLYLQKFRLMDVFDYKINFPEQYNEWPCCKLFLQPFVENSILHGFEGWEKGGKIEIAGEEQGDRLVITVRDNGCGMSMEKEEGIKALLDGKKSLDCNQSGIGISNAAARLRMYYGPEMEICLETREGEGTCFIFWLPIPADLLEDSEVSEEENN